VGSVSITDTELPLSLVLAEVNVNGRRGSPVLVVSGRNY